MENNHHNYSDSTNDEIHISETIDVYQDQKHSEQLYGNYQFNSNHQYESQMKQDEEQDNRLMAMLIYLLSLFTGIIGPLIIWLIKRKESKLVDIAGKTYLNYFISYSIYAFVGTIFALIPLFLVDYNENLTAILVIFTVLIFIALFVLAIMSFVCTIIACVKYMSGKAYSIPLTIPFFK